jgi:ADP-ribosylglycohydrolase
MARDDDIDYTILGLHTLEENGLDFTSRDIANQWLSHLPYHMVYTAERAAYRNLVNGLEPPDSAVFRNPYREWIGAQIRADAFGYVAPGMPEVAAEFAFRDAAVSHVKNGIYGEMFVAAMLAAAFTTSNMEEIITIGLSEIPQNSRLAEAVRDVLDWSKKFPRWESAWEQVMQKYGGYHGVHTINNAAIVLLGLLYGGNDLTQTISIAVMGGLDTDCNGATAGSILGAAEGASALPSRWTAPLNDTIRSVVVGFDNSRISDLAARTVAVARRVRERFGG